jgi:hypothetical protein
MTRRWMKMNIGEEKREVTFEPIPETAPVEEPSPELEPVVEPEKEPVGV